MPEETYDDTCPHCGVEIEDLYKYTYDAETECPMCCGLIVITRNVSYTICAVQRHHTVYASSVADNDALSESFGSRQCRWCDKPEADHTPDMRHKFSASH